MSEDPEKVRAQKARYYQKTKARHQTPERRAVLAARYRLRYRTQHAKIRAQRRSKASVAKPRGAYNTALARELQSNASMPAQVRQPAKRHPVERVSAQDIKHLRDLW